MKNNQKQLDLFKRLEQVAQFIPNPVYWKDKNGVILGVNDFGWQAWEGFFTAKDIIGKTVYEFYPQDIADELTKSDNEVLHKGIIENKEEKIILPNGKIKYFMATKKPLYSENGEIVGLVGSSIDVTDRRNWETLTLENQIIGLESKIKEQAKIFEDYLNDSIKTSLPNNFDVDFISFINSKPKSHQKIFEQISRVAQFIPNPVYWKDENGTVVGGNEFSWQIFEGLLSAKDILGKTNRDFYPEEIARELTKSDNEVLFYGKIENKEEVIILPSGKTKYFIATKKPLRDESGEIIGLVGSSIDITERRYMEHMALEHQTLQIEKQIKEQLKDIICQVGDRESLLEYSDNKNDFIYDYLYKLGYSEAQVRIFSNLELITNCIPNPVYWKDKNGIMLGGNKLCKQEFDSFLRFKDIIGKTVYDFYPQNIADELTKSDNEVLYYGKIENKEEEIVLPNGKRKYYQATKKPLYDDNGEIIGFVGSSIDITERKELEQMELEKQKYEIEILKQEEFKKIVIQVVHDIRSPLASLKMILSLSEDKLHNDPLIQNLKNATSRISDVANQLVAQYNPATLNDKNPQQKEHLVSAFERHTDLVSMGLSEIITEKRYEYINLRNIQFIENISSNAYFVCIKLDMIAFKRTLSNLINNAVDALDNKVGGQVTVCLKSENNLVELTVEDNGCGMSQEVIDKITNGIMVTSGKVSGLGVGWGQIRDTLANNEGKMTITSEVGIGTKVTLNFPRVPCLDYIAEKIELQVGDWLIILDDDISLLGSWDMKFNSISSKVNIKHFEKGQEAIDFINSLGATEKENVFLLTDYELLHQGLNGLDVVKQTNVKRCILVTSYHNNEEVRNLAKTTHTKILPKPLAFSIEVILSGDESIKLVHDVAEQPSIRNVDVVIIDDDQFLVNTILEYVLKDKTVDKYYTIQSAKEKISLYPKETKFVIDNYFDNEAITGIAFAEELYQRGFINLYLFSGTDFSNNNSLPHYLKSILKTDIDTFRSEIVGN